MEGGNSIFSKGLFLTVPAEDSREGWGVNQDDS